MQLPHRVIAGAILLASLSPMFVRAEDMRAFSCLHATTLPMLAPDAVPRNKGLLLPRNLSWSAEFASYVFVPALEFDLSSVPRTAKIESAALKLYFLAAGPRRGDPASVSARSPRNGSQI